MVMLNLDPLRYIPIQQEYLHSTARFIAAFCGRRSGKTAIAKRRMARALISQHPTNDHPLYLWGLPVEDQAKNTAWYDFQRIFEPLKSICTFRDMTIEIQTGIRKETGKPTSSKLLVRGLMNPTRYEGVGYCGVVLDEMSDVPPEAYTHSLLPTLTDINCRGWIMLIGVPKRSGIGASFFRGKCEEWSALSETNPLYACFNWTSKIILSPDELAQAEHELDPKTFREQFLATWETASGLVYYAFNKHINVYSEDVYDPSKPLIIGSDFNVEPMGWVICQEINGKLFVLDEIYIKNTTTEDTLNHLYRRWGHHPSEFHFYGDAAGKGRHTVAYDTDYTLIQNDQRFKDKKVYYKQSNPAVIDRVGDVNHMLRDAAGETRLFIHSRCRELIKDFEYIAYHEYTRDIDKSDPKRTHVSDALGYVIHYKYPMRKLVEHKGKVAFHHEERPY